MQHDTNSPTLVIADDRRFEIVHSSALSADVLAGFEPGAREGWFYHPEGETAAAVGPSATFEQAAADLEEKVGSPDYTAFVFEAGADTAAFERTLPSDYVHTGADILIPTILGLERLSEPRRWLEARGIPHLVVPAGYRQADLFPDDEDDDDIDLLPDDEDEPEIAGPTP